MYRAEYGLLCSRCCCQCGSENIDCESSSVTLTVKFHLLNYNNSNYSISIIRVLFHSVKLTHSFHNQFSSASHYFGIINERIESSEHTNGMRRYFSPLWTDSMSTQNWPIKLSLLSLFLCVACQNVINVAQVYQINFGFNLSEGVTCLPTHIKAHISFNMCVNFNRHTSICASMCVMRVYIFLYLWQKKKIFITKINRRTNMYSSINSDWQS